MILGPGEIRLPSSIKQSILADLRWQMSNVGRAVFSERTIRVVSYLRRKFGWNYRGCAHPGEHKKPKPWGSTMIFMIPKTKKPGGSKQGSTGTFRTHTQPPSHPVSFFPLCLPDLACHVVDSTARRHDFSFSHIQPILGWHQFHARSHPISPIVVSGNATSYLGHVFVIKSSPISTSL